MSSDSGAMSDDDRPLGANAASYGAGTNGHVNGYTNGNGVPDSPMSEDEDMPLVSGLVICNCVIVVTHQISSRSLSSLFCHLEGV